MADSDRMFSEAAASKVLSPWAGIEPEGSAASHCGDKTQTASTSAKAATILLIRLGLTRGPASPLSVISPPPKASRNPVMARLTPPGKFRSNRLPVRPFIAALPELRSRGLNPAQHRGRHA